MGRGTLDDIVAREGLSASERDDVVRRLALATVALLGQIMLDREAARADSSSRNGASEP
jgi:hypothetical protein